MLGSDWRGGSGSHQAHEAQVLPTWRGPGRKWMRDQTQVIAFAEILKGVVKIHGWLPTV